MQDQFDAIYVQSSKKLVKYLFEILSSGDNSRNGKNDNRLLMLAALMLLIVLAIIGVEVVVLLMRKNFGSKGLKLERLIPAILIFFGIAYIGFHLQFIDPESYFTRFNSGLMIAILYSFLGILCLVKLIHSKGSPNDKFTRFYRGESQLLGFLIQKNTKSSHIQNFYEPWFFLSLGVFLSGINILLGLPLVFCAISYWLHLLTEKILSIRGTADKMADHGYVIMNDQEYRVAE